MVARVHRYRSITTLAAYYFKGFVRAAGGSHYGQYKKKQTVMHSQKVLRAIILLARQKVGF